MNSPKIFSIFLSALVLYSMFSCKNGTGHSQEVDSNNYESKSNDTVNNPAGKIYTVVNGVKKYHGGLRLVKGDKYLYTLKAGIATNLEINDKEIETNNESEIGLIYEVVKDSANTFLLKITYNKLHLKLHKTDTDDQEFDADNAAETQDQMDKLLSDIKGSSIMILVNDKGDVLSAAGGQEIMDKIMKPMAMESLETKKKVGGFVDKLTGENFIQENMKEGFKVFPVGGVSEGDSWNNRTTQSAEMKFDVNSKYTFSSLDDGIALIDVEGIIDNIKDQKTKFMGYDVTTSLSGTQSGQFKLDISSGLIIYSKTSTSINGNLQLFGKDVPVKIKVKKESKAKKM